MAEIFHEQANLFSLRGTRGRVKIKPESEYLAISL